MRDTNIQKAKSKAGLLMDAILLLLLLAFKFLLVAPALAPSSLYRDDAWQALAVRVNGPVDITKTGVTAPGFAWGLRLLGAAPLSEIALQTPALVAGLLGPLLLFILARWWGLSRAASLLCAMLLCVAPTHTEYTIRVKPYTLDALATIACLMIAKVACDQPNKRLAWFLLIGFSTVAFLISATAGLAAFAMVIAVAVIRRLDARTYESSDFVLLAIYVTILGLWYVFILDAKSNEALYAYWQNRFVAWNDGPTAVLKSLLSNGARVFSGLIPDQTDTAQVPSALRYLIPLALLYGVVAAAGLAMLTKSNWRYGMIVAAPFLLAVTLFMAGKFPLGGGRTDLYLAPLVALLAAHILEWRRLQSYSPWIGAITCCVLAIAAIVGAKASYPREDLRSLTVEVEQQAGPDDRILVFPETTYMYALYSRAQVRVVNDPLSMTGFTPALSDPRVSMMPGMQFSTSIYKRGEAVCLAQLEQAIRANPTHIWLVASTYYSEDTLPILDERLKEMGWHEQRVLHQANAAARVWVKDASLPSEAP